MKSNNYISIEFEMEIENEYINTEAFQNISSLCLQ